jgi:hypothetical protein
MSQKALIGPRERCGVSICHPPLQASPQGLTESLDRPGPKTPPCLAVPLGGGLSPPTGSRLPDEEGAGKGGGT